MDRSDMSEKSDVCEEINGLFADIIRLSVFLLIFINNKNHNTRQTSIVTNRS